MKKVIILPVLILFSTAIFSQGVESAQLGAEFHEVATNGQPMGIQSYGSNKVEGSQFFYPTWTSGSVTTINNEVISKNYSFLYDKVRQQLFIKREGSSLVLLAEKDQMRGFTLNTDKVYNFVSASVYDPSDTTNFFEVLVSNNKGYSLLKLVKATFEKADQTDMVSMKDGDMSDKFVDDISYYISYNNGIPKKITSKEKSIEKAFPSVKGKIADYYNQHGKGTDDSFLTGLVLSLND